MMMVSICCLAAVFAGVHADGDGGKPSPPPPAIEFDATLNDYAVPHLPQALRNHQPELFTTRTSGLSARHYFGPCFLQWLYRLTRAPPNAASQVLQMNPSVACVLSALSSRPPPLTLVPLAPAAPPTLGVYVPRCVANSRVCVTDKCTARLSLLL